MADTVTKSEWLVAIHVRSRQDLEQFESLVPQARSQLIDRVFDPFLGEQHENGGGNPARTTPQPVTGIIGACVAEAAGPACLTCHTGNELG